MCEPDWYARVCNEGWRFARKLHRCACNARIIPGTLYYSWSGLGPDGWHTEALCYSCRMLSLALDAVGHEHAVGEAEECIVEMGGFDSAAWDIERETKKGAESVVWDNANFRNRRVITPFKPAEVARRAWAERIIRTAGALARGEHIQPIGLVADTD